jgi:hypothetical protein
VSTYQVGNTITWGLAVTDATGVAADVGTGPTALVTLPDATTSAATVVKVSTGTYTATLTAAQAGRHRVAWSGSGVNSGGLNPYTDVADVWPADPRLIIGLADARAALNVASSSRVNDDDLRGYLVAAGVVIEHIVGTVLTRTIVESHDGYGRMGIALNEMPTAITTVVENGTTLAATDYYLDTAGVLWRGAHPGGGTWSGIGRTVVTYTAGSSTVPQNVILAAGHLIRHWWNQTQQSYRPYMGATMDEPVGVMVAGYAVPNFVVDLLAPSMSNRMPGFA